MTKNKFNIFLIAIIINFKNNIIIIYNIANENTFQIVFFNFLLHFKNL